MCVCLCYYAYAYMSIISCINIFIMYWTNTNAYVNSTKIWALKSSRNICSCCLYFWNIYLLISCPSMSFFLVPLHFQFLLHFLSIISFFICIFTYSILYIQLIYMYTTIFCYLEFPLGSTNFIFDICTHSLQAYMMLLFLLH